MGPEGIKWELGLGGFCPGKMGLKPLVLGFGHCEREKNVKNQKWKWDLSIAKWDFKKQKAGKWDWYPPVQYPLFYIFLIFLNACGVLSQANTWLRLLYFLTSELELQIQNVSQ